MLQTLNTSNRYYNKLAINIKKLINRYILYIISLYKQKKLIIIKTFQIIELFTKYITIPNKIEKEIVFRSIEKKIEK